MASQTAENPFNLAQYIVTAPVTKNQYDYLDVNPALLKLPEYLKEQLIAMFVFDDITDTLKSGEDPNVLLHKLALMADEFCPGRTYSDLLYKQLIVSKSFNDLLKGVLTSMLKSPSAPIALDKLMSMLKDIESLKREFKF